MYKTTAHTRLTQLIKKYSKGTATPQEAAFVEQYYAYFDKKSPLTESMTKEEIETLRYKMLAQVHEQMNTPAIVHRVHFLKTSWFRYAAAIILIVGGVAIWYTLNTPARHFEGPRAQREGLRNLAADIQPGTNRATLTVDNNTINLSNNKTGIAINDAIAYNDGERIADAGQQLTLSTPKGGQYQATLPDGSKVWLNAASSIKFPSKFTGNTREVEVTGEAYLEVAQNAKQPFYVHTRKTSIRVLGTSFNINSYADEEAEKTTLIEGSVKVIQHPAPSFRRSDEGATEKSRFQAAGVVLRPGQQSVTINQSNTEKITVKTISTDEVIAWRSGLFQFNRTPLPDVMRQLSRWYDVEVVYANGISDIQLEGRMKRDLTLNQVLDGLGELGVKFKIEGKKLIVL